MMTTNIELVRKKIQQVKFKHLSVLSLVVLVILTYVKLTKPDFYNQYFEAGNKNVGSELKSNVGSGFNPEPTSKEKSSKPTLSTDMPLCSDKQECTVRVTNVVDGDTVDISTGERVRYIGVDTPETKHPIKKVECFGQEASEKNKELVQDKEVRLEKDVSDKDKYGRLLRYIYVGDLFVNDFLARNGFAHAATFPPDVKFSGQFREAEREARENNRGLWAAGACPNSSAK